MSTEERCTQCSEAVQALLQFVGSKSTQPADDPLGLFASAGVSAQPIAVDVSFLRAPRVNRVPHYFTLPHEVQQKPRVCLITPTPADKFAEQLEDHTTVIDRVMDVAVLQGKYSQPVARRALAKSFDSFYVHHGVKEFPTVLTGEFLDHQTPVWLGRSKKGLLEDIALTQRLAVCPRRGHDCVSVVVGHSDMARCDLEANILAFVSSLVGELQGGWLDVHSFRVAASTKENRVALPFYAHNFSESPEEPARKAPRNE